MLSVVHIRGFVKMLTVRPGSQVHRLITVLAYRRIPIRSLQQSVIAGIAHAATNHSAHDLRQPDTISASAQVSSYGKGKPSIRF
jgi:hypothetical protein